MVRHCGHQKVAGPSLPPGRRRHHRALVGTGVERPVLAVEQFLVELRGNERIGICIAIGIGIAIAIGVVIAIAIGLGLAQDLLPGLVEQQNPQGSLGNAFGPVVVLLKEFEIALQHGTVGRRPYNGLKEAPPDPVGRRVDPGRHEFRVLPQILPEIVPDPHVDVQVKPAVLQQGRPATNVRLVHSLRFVSKVRNESRPRAVERVDAVLVVPKEDLG
mmetsp:Transcript_18632/g.52073  ORF Transcript_18632/g.52073 Transcript_18632/m.52073 type:complete len:216 (+) Transcript_18632:730-1377(+)